MNSGVLRTYYFALKIIFLILNKTTQYISFIAITLFITFFLFIKQGLIIYEDLFINSLKGLYPEFITSSTSVANSIKSKYNVNIKNEIFVHSEEVEFSYDGKEDISKFMNVRTYDNQYKSKLFDTLIIEKKCYETNETIWLSSRLFDNMSQDTVFDKQFIYFKDEDDNYIKFPICTFKLDNNEKWLLTSTANAKRIAYMPFAKKVIYTDDKKAKEALYKIKGVNNWKQYIDYDDLGLFLLAKEVSSTFLITFFIFLMAFMVIAFSSLAKEFSVSVFLTKLFGLNIYKSVLLYTIFFIIYTFAIAFVVYLEFNIISYFIHIVAHFDIPLDGGIFSNILEILVILGFVVSLLISLKYHRLPL